MNGKTHRLPKDCARRHLAFVYNIYECTKRIPQQPCLKLLNEGAVTITMFYFFQYI